MNITYTKIKSVAEHGEVAVVESGMDCDCVQYSGHVTITTADVRAVEDHIAERLAWADGPINFRLMKPSEARGLVARSRDLALEAYENGHQHVVRPYA